jgi:hypothetical protein
MNKREFSLNENKLVQSAYDKTCHFMVNACHDREQSHGAQHMKAVCTTAIRYFIAIFGARRISTSERVEKLFIMVIMVALLHDVADHKYDKDGRMEEKVWTFLGKNCWRYGVNPRLIGEIIFDISLSKEIKKIKSGEIENSTEYWAEKYGKYAVVRHIVSDADKLEATGIVGFERFKQFIIEEFLAKQILAAPDVSPKLPTPEYLRKLLAMKLCMDSENNLIRYPKYFHTKQGKIDAIRAHEDLKACLAKFLRV